MTGYQFVSKSDKLINTIVNVPVVPYSYSSGNTYASNSYIKPDLIPVKVGQPLSLYYKPKYYKLVYNKSLNYDSLNQNTWAIGEFEIYNYVANGNIATVNNETLYGKLVRVIDIDELDINTAAQILSHFTNVPNNILRDYLDRIEEEKRYDLLTSKFVLEKINDSNIDFAIQYPAIKKVIENDLTLLIKYSSILGEEALDKIINTLKSLLAKGISINDYLAYMLSNNKLIMKVILDDEIIQQLKTLDPEQTIVLLETVIAVENDVAMLDKLIPLYLKLRFKYHNDIDWIIQTLFTQIGTILNLNNSNYTSVNDKLIAKKLQAVLRKIISYAIRNADTEEFRTIEELKTELIDPNKYQEIYEKAKQHNIISIISYIASRPDVDTSLLDQIVKDGFDDHIIVDALIQQGLSRDDNQFIVHLAKLTKDRSVIKKLLEQFSFQDTTYEYLIDNGFGYDVLLYEPELDTRLYNKAIEKLLDELENNFMYYKAERLFDLLTKQNTVVVEYKNRLIKIVRENMDQLTADVLAHKYGFTNTADDETDNIVIKAENFSV